VRVTRACLRRQTFVVTYLGHEPGVADLVRTRTRTRTQARKQ
jgi:hypothetical protein